MKKQKKKKRTTQSSEKLMQSAHSQKPRMDQLMQGLREEKSFYKENPLLRYVSPQLLSETIMQTEQELEKGKKLRLCLMGQLPNLRKVLLREQMKGSHLRKSSGLSCTRLGVENVTSDFQ